jgi:hypothetical protein
MKASLLLKVILIAPILLFADYLIMVIIGCFADSCGLGEGFFCGIYCTIGKFVLGLTALIFMGFLFSKNLRILTSK